MVKKIGLSILLGLLITFFVAQYDLWVHKKIIGIGQKIAHDYLEGNFLCTIQSLSFFSPSVVLCDVEMSSIEPDAWSWRCKKLEVSCSWLQLLFKGVMEQHIIIDGFECSSRVHEMHCAIEPHCIAMIQKSFLPFPTQAKSIIFKNAHFFIDDRNAETALSVFFNSSSLRIGNQIRTAMSMTDGIVTYKNDNYIEKIATDISLTTGYIGDTLDAHCNIAGTFLLSHMGDCGGCYLAGQWKSNHGRFSVRSMHNSVMIDPIVITEHEVRINARFPLSYIAQCMRNSTEHQMINGAALIAAKIRRDESRRVEGQIVVEDVMINQHHLCDVAKIVFTRHEYDWLVKLGFNRRNEECKGSGFWHENENKGELTIANATELSAKALPYWRIKHNQFLVHMIADNDSVVGTYNAMATNILTNGNHTVHGDFLYDKGVFSNHTSIDEDELFVAGQRFPEFKLERCLYHDKNEKQLVMLQQSSDNTKQIKGTVAFPFVRSLMHNIFQYDLQGEGYLAVTAELSQSEVITNFTLDDATIRLPQTYNFIDGFNARCVYNIDNNVCVVEDAHISLHTGIVHCLRATVYFDTYGKLIFAHVPVVFDHCLLNIKKDLFAIVSGNLFFSQNVHSGALVSGRIVIDKAQLKENLFSGIIQKQLFSYTHSAFSLPDMPVKCDLTIETQSPIRVDTAFLQTDAKVNVRVQKSMRDPSIVGSIILHSGMLNFPYKPLYITKGAILFLSEQLFDPTIELVARNKIKKYDVVLQVEGTLSNHHIMLDSTPPLSEEQIVGLLLVGSEENSLNSMMPALIVQNLKNLIFSNNQSTFLDKYFKPLLRTFNINLVPSFTDQTGRGGLRGALEITIDDRWKAVIQKNFSLTEDTKFELEFLLSDDITLRAIRDERRDIGGEVEMRWKF